MTRGDVLRWMFAVLVLALIVWAIVYSRMHPDPWHGCDSAGNGPQGEVYETQCP